ncbi:MAG: sulfatase [bacterium]
MTWPRVLGLALLAGALAGCAREPAKAPADRPDLDTLVLVTLDTFRQDRLGSNGDPQTRTPNFDRFARRAACWRNAVTAIPLTTPSHATILSGLSPRGHGLIANRMRLDESVITLPMRLRDAGWRTAAVVSARVVLGPEFGLDRGFDTYDVIEPATRPASGEGAQTTETARRVLAEHDGRPTFLWAHFFDAHLPYAPPAPWDGIYDPGYDGAYREPSLGLQRELAEGDDVDARDVAWLAAQYAGEISFLDRCFGDLLRDVDLDRAAVLVTADHGEGLYEHRRYFGHDTLLYDTALRVPFLLRTPDARGGVRSEDARTLDVAATLAGVAGLPTGGTEGRDLRRAAPRTGDDTAFVAETHPAREKAWPSYALRNRDSKLIWSPRSRTRECYDLVSDPAERHDLSGEGSDYFRILGEDLELDLRTRPTGTIRTVDDERGGPDDATLEQLKALGYAG